jgi:hypothetical protein
VPYLREEAIVEMGRRALSLAALVVGVTVITGGDALAQQKYQVTQSPASTSQYLQQHVISVEDAPQHQIRVYEIRFEYPKNDFSIAGVLVKETFVRGISDYVGFSGPFTTYVEYRLQDGSKVFGRGTGTSMMTKDATGNHVVKFSAVENLVGGTGRFKGIRGQLHSIGQREVVAKTVTQQLTGEYWIEE